jgi:hypothetical protein
MAGDVATSTAHGTRRVQARQPPRSRCVGPDPAFFVVERHPHRGVFHRFPCPASKNNPDRSPARSTARLFHRKPFGNPLHLKRGFASRRALGFNEHALARIALSKAGPAEAPSKPWGGNRRRACHRDPPDGRIRGRGKFKFRPHLERPGNVRHHRQPTASLEWILTDCPLTVNFPGIRPTEHKRGFNGRHRGPFGRMNDFERDLLNRRKESEQRPFPSTPQGLSRPPLRSSRPSPTARSPSSDTPQPQRKKRFSFIKPHLK